MNRKLLPDCSVLDELLLVEHETGRIFWRVRDRKWFKSDVSWRRWNEVFATKEGFTATNRQGYLRSSILCMECYAHRVVWKSFYRTEPPAIIDHINGDTSFNGISNLQEATTSQNCHKSKLSRDGKHSRFRGVSYSMRDKRWLVTCTVRGAAIHGGRFIDEVEAAKSYNALAQHHFGEFATLNEV
jgi:hypothetical protein